MSFQISRMMTMSKNARSRKVAKVMLAVPSQQDWKADMAMCMMQVVAMASMVPEGFDDLELSIHNSKGSIIQKQRRHLVEQGLKMGATHILFIDSDMTFPSWILHKLIKWDKPIVACNCSTKSFPSNPTARSDNGTPSGGLVFTTVEKVAKDELEQVWRVGTGVMLIKMDVFKKLTAPYFSPYYNVEHGEEVGEDWAFCEEAEKAGFPIYIDHAASSQVGHIGCYSFSQSDVNNSHAELLKPTQIESQFDSKLEKSA